MTFPMIPDFPSADYDTWKENETIEEETCTWCGEAGSPCQCERADRENDDIQSETTNT